MNPGLYITKRCAVIDRAYNLIPVRRSLLWLAFISTFAIGPSLVARPAPQAPQVVNVTRMWFTPPVVPETYTDMVRFEATVTDNPATVGFQYGGIGVDRPMYDDGTHGDLVANDGTWTILFTANEILSRVTPGQVFRPFIGLCRPAGAGSFNAIAEVWTSSIGLANAQPIDAAAQRTNYVVNFVASKNDLISLNPAMWAQRFYSIFGDDFDFLNLLLVTGTRGNRFHFAVSNSVTGIGLGVFNNTPAYGSQGRLKGISVFPIPYFFDGGGVAFNHETGHQWIDFLQNTPFASGIPHWPRGNIAINVMGFSVGGGGGEGGPYSYTFTPNGQGGFTVGMPNPANLNQFNSMEMYLMGLVTPAEVGSFFVLNDQTRNLSFGETLNPGDITTVTVNNVIGVHGPRAPTSATSPKIFHSAVIVLSEQLLDIHALSLYDWFARRADSRQTLACSSGLSQGVCRPFFLATNGRATMVSRLTRSKADMAIDFGSQGLWTRTDGPGWTNLHNLDPSHVASADIDGNGRSDIIVDFPGYGVWAWMNNITWIQIHASDVTGIATGDLDGNGKADLLLSFPGYGLYAYMNNGAWNWLHPSNPSSMATGDIDLDGKSDLVVDFPGLGVWVRMNNTSWTSIHGLDVVAIAVGDLDGAGGAEILLSFPTYGLYMLRNGAWTRLHDLTPPRIALGDIDGNGQGDALVDLPGYGVWTLKNLTTWTQIHPLNASVLTMADIDGNDRADAIISFPGAALWTWMNDASFQYLHPLNPDTIAAGDIDGN